MHQQMQYNSYNYYYKVKMKDPIGLYAQVQSKNGKQCLIKSEYNLCIFPKHQELKKNMGNFIGYGKIIHM